MPELPEVETICRGMERSLLNKRLSQVITRREGMRFPFSKEMDSSLAGQKIRKIWRRAKYAVIDFEKGQVLVLHMGMSGRVLLVPDIKAYACEKHDHFILRMDDDSALVFNDARRFGYVLMFGNARDAHSEIFSHLGPEPLEDGFSASSLYEALKGRKGPVKNLLLDQRIVSGLGNIYVCEALYESAISPERSGQNVTKKECALLAANIKAVLKKAIAAGGSSLKDYRHADGALGYFQHQFLVYGREGELCKRAQCVKDDARILRITQSGRSSFYCPTCQK